MAPSPPTHRLKQATKRWMHSIARRCQNLDATCALPLRGVFDPEHLGWHTAIESFGYGGNACPCKRTLDASLGATAFKSVRQHWPPNWPVHGDTKPANQNKVPRRERSSTQKKHRCHRGGKRLHPCPLQPQGWTPVTFGKPAPATPNQSNLLTTNTSHHGFLRRELYMCIPYPVLHQRRQVSNLKHVRCNMLRGLCA